MTRIDPIYWLVRLILKPFYEANLVAHEKAFVEENARKHANILWLTLIVSLIAFWGLQRTPREDFDRILLALTAPLAVTGLAWYSITFGGIPQRLISIAMWITFLLFLAFMVSLSTMFIALLFIVDWLIWPSLALIYVGLTLCGILYDTSDGLKAGLDEALLKHSRAALLFYEEQGIVPKDNNE